ncbi:PLP-dependent aminotransferase family protein [Salegentibacter salarius]|uniref:Cystathionine beta-synthase n=1 Tax=Salegentibacter salarius TaxID=435906 RepID=A0A2N0U1E4_9FLAO|nr:PLP-dependent transferase [Salegentibacter salarius]OEY73646.1 cystathionine beta-synthase [Salegentibacter salarius]PKD20817.1 cystathionine beta-synthase [Salegentibacter salarius]SLJ95059.1 Cys/Met metabolism PLP-dependent enzyme [Salegentibacter salarius]
MKENKLLNYIEEVLKNMPTDWLKLTTHRLDIYNESLAKTQFLKQFEALYKAGNSKKTALNELPTAFDYIRLGHPLSSVLEWGIAHLNGLKTDNVISFSSRTIPVLAILRKNLFDNKNTRIVYTGELPDFFDFETIRRVYRYNFELKQVESAEDISDFNGSTIFISQNDKMGRVDLNPEIDFLISLHPPLGSLLLVNGDENEAYISEIQHVRRRETIAMTPDDSFSALQQLIGKSPSTERKSNVETNKASVVDSIHEITATKSNVQLGSCGLSIQYAIMMGLIDDALEKHPGKDIKIIVPPNCYGGTNDQARRVAACVKNVEVLDLHVDGDDDMVKSTDQVLAQVAKEGAVPYIIAEIPTNPRVEVPDLEELKIVLSKTRKTATDEVAIDPVFILDQTFCPNVQFLSKDGILSSIRTISYVSGSKFPSGGKCTAGYCVANEKAEELMPTIEKHLQLCDNEATDLQVEILAEQLPSMNQRIKDAYKNTREFVNFIEKKLPEAKINFVSEDLAEQGFTPSVFSLDLPTKGNSDEEKETYKRALNQKLINMMISEIPNESKYCVSYGQLKGCYWTIPATSTQGTTKEDDKDYIARVSVSPNLELEHHKKVFSDFVEQI